MSFQKFLILGCLPLLVSVPVLADIIVSATSGAGFISGVTPTATGNGGFSVTDPNQSPAAYWDHQSLDATGSATCNAGYIVTKQSLSGCGSLNPSGFTTLGADDPLATSYWGLTGRGITGNYDPSFVFTNTSISAVELELTITGNSTDQFGYYDAAHPTGVLLFTAAGIAETTLFIPAGDTFGFFLTSPTGATFKTQSDGIQHFAVFSTDNAGGNSANKTTNNYYVGVEDLAGPSDFDYNDILVHVQAVPEPGDLPVLITGLAGLVLIARRRLAR